MTSLTPIVFALVTAGVIVFQIALALGAPWGAYAMGGRSPGRFPPAMRIAAIAQAILLVLAVVIVLSDAGLIQPSASGPFPWLIWLVVAFSAISLVLNTITPSARERRIWAPVALVMFLCSLSVALTP